MTPNQDPPAVARPHVPEHLDAGPGAPVLMVRPRISFSSRAAEAGVDGPAPDPGAAEDIDALPGNAPIDAANRAGGSWREPWQMQRSVKLRPRSRGCAERLDQR